MGRLIGVWRVIVTCLAAFACACATQQGKADGAGAPQGGASAMPNQLTNEERDAGWKLLFDGSRVDQWRVYHSQSPSAGWSAKDGTLRKTGPTDDIITRDQFADFELTFDWKISPAGNAGVFYRGTEEYVKIYWSAPEYQLLDDANHDDGRNRFTSAGAAYGLYPSPAGAVKPAGEWNATRIVVKGPHVEHWLNGRKLLEYELWSSDWEAKVKASKFVEWPKYGRAQRGHIAIQGDHEGDLALRNIRIRDLQ